MIQQLSHKPRAKRVPLQHTAPLTPTNHLSSTLIQCNGLFCTVISKAVLDIKGLGSQTGLISSVCVFSLKQESFFDTSILISPTYFAVVHIVLWSWSTELDSFQMKLSQKMCSKNTSNVLHLLQSVGRD